MPEAIKVSVIGATGYTGLELLRLMRAHPGLQVVSLVSNRHPGESMSSLWPHLSGVYPQSLESFDAQKLISDSQCVFLALPHGESQAIVPELLGKVKIIDLAGDFRLKDAGQFNKYYGTEHQQSSLLSQFVYGAPEFFRNDIKTANAVANPGCFALATELALYPLKDAIVSAEVLAITGSSGAGKTLSDGTHHPVRSHNVMSYKIGRHQHLPEISQALTVPVEKLSFVPTSGPFVRGIHLTAFVRLTESMTADQVKGKFAAFYKSSPFIRLKDTAAVAEVVGSNYCDISITTINDVIIIQAVLDNLVKGAAGTALQNFNLMFGLEETMGLDSFSPIFP